MMQPTEQSAIKNYSVGNYAEAWNLCRLVLKSEPGNSACNTLMGIMCNKVGRYTDAEKHLRIGLKLEQPSIIVLTELATSLIELGNLDEAQSLLLQAAQIDNHNENIFILQAKIFQLTNDIESAQALLRRLLQINPRSVAGLNSLASLLAENCQSDEAVNLLLQAIEIEPEQGAAFKKLGLLHLKNNNHKAALPLLLKANKLLPSDIDVLFAIGKVLDAGKQLQKAIKVYQRILALEPTNGEAMMLAGINNWHIRNYDEAVSYFDKVYKAHPFYTEAFYRLMRCKADMADWVDYEQLHQKLIDTIIKDLQNPRPLACSPMDLHYYNLPDNLQYKVMRRFSQQRIITAKKNFNFGRRNHNKIRIGYLSPDFRSHALGMSVYKMFGCHNRDQFEVYVFSQYIPNPNDPFHNEIKNTANRFFDLQGMDEYASAQLIYDNEIDILVDFGGYSSFTKSGILSLKPAPIILHMFGQPDTTAMSQVDYFISDHNLIDGTNRQFYTEKIVYLPHGFICSPIEPSGQSFTRADFGIADNAFVFCSFCSPYKYEPRMFSVWMQLLKQVDNSVLWLMTNNNKTFEQNIINSAEQHGVSKEQIVFAKPMPIADHLQRMKLCDLFLDTLHYSSCSTASHALMIGLPVLTLRGNTNASRQGATVCKASGLFQTICNDMVEYYHKAIELATCPQKLSELKVHLLQNHNNIPHFDISLNVRYIENAYRTIWQRYESGEVPSDTAITNMISQTYR
ncbi:MAG: tetratricopeptide repeat protein [Bacteroidales bacterium]